MFGDPSIPYDPRLEDQPMEDVKDSLTPADERATLASSREPRHD